jgi:hypothetical protein
MHEPPVQPPLARFAVPYQFQPRLTFLGALLAVVAALTQIILGCLVAALWGVRIWMAAVSEHGMPWKILVIATLAAGMAISLGLLFWGIKAVMRRINS